MRAFLTLLLAIALAGAGCLGIGEDAAAATDDARSDVEVEAAQDDARPAEDGRAPTPSPAAPPASDPTTAPSHSASTNESDPASAPPEVQPVPWSLVETARLGWIVAAGVGGDVAPQGQADADHCPWANFTVPEGATRLELRIGGDHVAAPDGGAGTYAIVLTGADGSVTYLEPFVDELHPLTGDEGSQREFAVDVPAPGAWSLEAQPVGPTVMQVWTVELSLAGLSLAPPEGLELAGGCGG